MRKSKPKLKLISKIIKDDKDYECVEIKLSNDLDVFYDLSLWKFYMDSEWIDLVKKDKSGIHSYFIYNIISVKFERKIHTTLNVNPELKPVA
jgi:hypothetical protein